MDDVIYVYGFVSPDASPPPRALSGIHGAAVEAADADGIRVIMSRLAADDLSPASIDRHLEDMNWVGARGLEHERVVAWFVDNGGILPVSLFTMYTSLDSMRSEVGARAGDIRHHMDRLHGRREWDVKVAIDRDTFASHAGDVMAGVQAIDSEMATAAAGRRFLLERKRAELVKNELNDAARRVARTLLEELAAHAEDVVALPLPRADVQAVVLNAALLVHHDNEAGLNRAAATRIEELARIGMHASLTGPWAPYRFLEERDVPAG